MADNDNIPGKPKSGLSDLVTAESMIQLAIALPVGCVLGGLLGEALDKHFHTGWLAFTGVMLGAAGGFVQIYRVASGLLKRGDRS